MKKDVTENQLIIYGLYSLILDSFQHYNKIQIVYRNFASMWLLAAFAGIGYSLSTNEESIPFHPLIIVSLICIAAYIGISLICFLDLIVSEKSITTVVHDGLNLEKENPWLPQIISVCGEINHLLRYINTKSFFYIGCYVIIFITFISAGIMFLISGEKDWTVWGILLGIFVLLILFSFWILLSGKRIDTYSKIEEVKKKQNV